jgi:hypothetical protein
MSSYTIVPYSADALRDALVEGSHGANGGVRDKPHAEYLHGYLSAIDAETMLIERRYVDRDYLEDFAAYHVRCFEQYKKDCYRLHFFSTRFDETDFEKVLLRLADATGLQGAYLGFVVIKPLPTTIIGRTCLAAYPRQIEDRTRNFPTLRYEQANLFGLDLKVESLPFQEQDQDVAACASSALWSVFHGTSRLFQHAALSPVEITKAAALHIRMENRDFPAGDGLTSNQIADAIRSVGLEPLALGIKHVHILKIAAHAYVQAGIPCLLLGKLYNLNSSSGARELRGRHAIAVTGFGMPNQAAGESLSNGRRFKALSAVRLYCHDDQVGPFASLHLEARGLVKYASSNVAETVIEPETLIVPLYHKIRISILRVIDETQYVDAVLDLFRTTGFLPVSDRITWDIRLTTVNDCKRSLAEVVMDEDNKRRLLLRTYPRFMWRLEASSGGKLLFDALLDATDLLQGQHLLDVVPHDKPVCRAIAAATSAVMGQLASISPSQIGLLAWFEANQRYLT